MCYCFIILIGLFPIVTNARKKWAASARSSLSHVLLSVLCRNPFCLQTMLTASVVRDLRVRSSFEYIAWINMNQTPNLLVLQRKLYEQLASKTSGQMPAKVHTSLENQLRELRKLASGKTALVVIDDIWDASHMQAFLCLDEATGEKP